MEKYQELFKKAKELYEKAAQAEDQSEFEELSAQAEATQQRAKAAQKAYGINDSLGGGVPGEQTKKAMDTLTHGSFDEEAVRAVLDALNASGVETGGYASGKSDDEVKSFGDFLYSVRTKDRRRLASVYGSTHKKYDNVKDLEGRDGSAGGYLVPEEYLANLLSVGAMGAVVRPRATVIPMRRRSLRIPSLDQEGTPGAYWKTDFFGGVLAYWTEEGGTKTEVEPAFSELELVAHKLAGYTQASDELLEDSAVALEALLRKLFGGAIVSREEYGFMRGTGVGQPLGILNSGALETQDRAVANDITYRDIARMMDQFLPQSYGNGVFVVNPTTLPELLTMEDTEGQNVWMPNASGGAQQGVPGYLIGMPVVVSEKVPALGNTGDVLLADFSYYVIGDRGETAIDSSEEFAFTSDLTTWRFVHRVDGQPWLDAPLYIDTTNTVSPFVALHADSTTS